MQKLPTLKITMDNLSPIIEKIDAKTTNVEKCKHYSNIKL